MGRLRVAGYAQGAFDGVGTNAQFSTPSAVAVGNGFALVTDTDNNLIRRVDLSNRIVTTIAGRREPGNADGIGTAAQFFKPEGISISQDGNMAIVCDRANNKLRHVSLVDSRVSTLAGSTKLGSKDGIGAASSFSSPTDAGIYYRKKLLCDDSCDTASNGVCDDESATSTCNWGSDCADCGERQQISMHALIADTTNHIIRSVDIAKQAVITVAGKAGSSEYQDGVGLASRFRYPAGIAIAPDSAHAYIAGK